MGLEKLFSNSFINNQVNSFQQRVETGLIEILKQAGSELVQYAKEKHNYQDKTGNLTNSIGYAVLRNGAQVAAGGFSGIGQSKGLQAAKKMSEKLFVNGTTLTLAIIAGMNYAAFVEAKGFNVLIPAELKAKADFLSMLREKINEYLK